MSSPAGRIVVGVHPVRELLRAGRRIDRIHLDAGRATSSIAEEIRALARDAGVPVIEVARGELDARAPGLVHQGVIAQAPSLDTIGLRELAARMEGLGEPALLVAVDGITDPQNLGSIARTAEAAGVHGLLVPERRNAGITPTVEKAAAGALAYLPVVEVGNLVAALDVLARAGAWSLGLDADADTELAEHPLAGEACVLVVGAEGRGLSRLVRERCDALVGLPMRGRVSSLNASVATGIALYTILARRA